ncbi:MAG: hypothetical protein KIS66_06175 [Fimbriimonadaceae bacterium]|nr:hypothetical protein [Fimbriimonadaceae bacterium]
MAEEPFQILGAGVPELIGRAAQLRQINGELAKKTPSHISLIGPKHSGKSVLLKGLTDRLREAGTPFSAVVLWDLAHSTPGSDDEFVSALGAQLASALPDFSKLLLGADYKGLRDILEGLGEDGFRILMAWDGFDKPLREGQLTRNLWDNMRELASLPSLRIITASRKRLQELISNERSSTSDFWGLFNVSVKLGPFDDHDLDEVLAIKNLSTSKGARTEIINCSGLYPPVTLALVNAIIEGSASSEVSNADVTSQVDRVLEDNQSLLASIWNDCDQPARELFYEVCEGELSVSLAAKGIRDLLIERGMALEAGGKIRRSSRLMELYAQSQEADTGTLKRQFGSQEKYAKNLHAVLQLRLAHLPTIDTRLKRLIELCLEDLPDSPDLCLTHVRDVGVRIADLMLIAELGPELKIPGAWISNWTANEFIGRNGEPLRTPEWFQSTHCPRENRERIDLLRLIINPKNVSPEATKCSRLCVEQLQLLKRLGDYGEHSGREEISVEAALAAINMCIEAAASLCRDLGGAPSV